MKYNNFKKGVNYCSIHAAIYVSTVLWNNQSCTDIQVCDAFCVSPGGKGL